MDTPVTTEIPTGFWGQIDHQLDRLCNTSTFDEVRQILLDPAYDQIQNDIHLNGQRGFATDSAFFAGSGGEESLQESLLDAGWSIVVAKAPYHYVMRHRSTGETLTYIEGDVERGDRITRGST